MICRHCRKDRAPCHRGLCQECWRTPAIRATAPPSKFAPKGEPTEEELEQTIAEQLKRLPPWWWKDVQRERWRASQLAARAPS